MGIYYCPTKGCGGYFCSVDMSYAPHAPFCEYSEVPEAKREDEKK